MYYIISSGEAGSFVTFHCLNFNYKTVVAEGSSKTFSFNGNSGFAVDSVFVNSVYKGSPSTYTVSNVTSDVNISVTFKAVPTFTISASSGINGSISPSGAIIISENTDTSFIISADSGYRIKSVIVDGIDQGAINSYPFSTVISDHEISAQFEALPTFTVSAAAAVNGTIEPAGNIVVNEGDSLAFIIIPNTGYRIADVNVSGVSEGPMAQLTIRDIISNIDVNASFIEESSGCADIQPWDASQNWTEYAAGDLRSDNNKYYECINTTYSFYKPSGSYGHFGWIEKGNCN